MTSVGIFLSISTTKRRELYQMDINNAFLDGDLTKEVYMRMPT